MQSGLLTKPKPNGSESLLVGRNTIQSDKFTLPFEEGKRRRHADNRLPSSIENLHHQRIRQFGLDLTALSVSVKRNRLPQSLGRHGKKLVRSNCCEIANRSVGALDPNITGGIIGQSKMQHRIVLTQIPRIGNHLLMAENMIGITEKSGFINRYL